VAPVPDSSNVSKQVQDSAAARAPDAAVVEAPMIEAHDRHDVEPASE
jgi:hypothetical protein